MLDLLCLGELLIDFVPDSNGCRLREVKSFQKAAGGAPANVAVGFSRLGGKSGFIGKIGADEFGCFLRQMLENNGVDTTYLYETREALTALAFVSLRKDGERDFMFYRRPAADMLLNPAEINAEMIAGAKIFHFGSISLIDEPVREATLKAAELAFRQKKVISYDPNLRPVLWPDLLTARREILGGMRRANIVKVSEEELEFISGEEMIENAVGKMFGNYSDLKLMVVTLGARGSVFCFRDQMLRFTGFKVKTLDTTGAGDGFTAGLLFLMCQLFQVNNQLLIDWDCRTEPGRNQWEKIGYFANAVGALVATKHGGMPAMPDYSRVREFLEPILKLAKYYIN